MISRLNYQVLIQPELDKATRAVSIITYGLVAVGKADGYSFEVVIDQVNSTDEDKLVSFIGSGGCQTHFKKKLVARELALFNPEKFMNLRLRYQSREEPPIVLSLEQFRSLYLRRTREAG